MIKVQERALLRQKESKVANVPSFDKPHVLKNNKQVNPKGHLLRRFECVFLRIPEAMYVSLDIRLRLR